MTRSPVAWITLVLFFALARSAPAQAQPPDRADLFADAVETARTRVVKLYGATIGAEKAYGSGVIVSPDGQIVTTLSILLEGRNLRVVLPDGRTFTPRVLARDERRQLALLKIDAVDLPFFELSTSAAVEPGDWVVAAANPFKVADGPEPVSISIGLLAGRATLAARHRARDFSYEGPVLLTDLVVTTPGSAGGALVDASGQLVGVIGKAVTSRYTNTWVNYALPVEEVAAFVARAAAPPTNEKPDSATHDRPLKPPDLGICLFDVGGRVRPAYVERVRPDSPAWKAGLRPNDLLVSVNGQPVATCADVEQLVASMRPGERLALVAKRGEELRVLELAAESPIP